jgi:hypothetical protein
MDSSTFLLFLIIMGLAFTTHNQTLMIIAAGVAVIFVVLMGGAHHVIIAIIALVILYFGYSMSQSTGKDDYMLYALLGAAVLFIVFVMKGKEQPEGGMDPYAMGGMGMPMGY